MPEIRTQNADRLATAAYEVTKEVIKKSGEFAGRAARAVTSSDQCRYVAGVGYRTGTCDENKVFHQTGTCTQSQWNALPDTSRYAVLGGQCGEDPTIAPSTLQTIATSATSATTSFRGYVTSFFTSAGSTIGSATTAATNHPDAPDNTPSIAIGIAVTVATVLSIALLVTGFTYCRKAYNRYKSNGIPWVRHSNRVSPETSPATTPQPPAPKSSRSNFVSLSVLANETRGTQPGACVVIDPFTLPGSVPRTEQVLSVNARVVNSLNTQTPPRTSQPRAEAKI